MLKAEEEATYAQKIERMKKEHEEEVENLKRELAEAKLKEQELRKEMDTLKEFYEEQLKSADKGKQVALAVQETAMEGKQGKKRTVYNKLFNFEVTLHVDGQKAHKVQAILDTGASSCCIDENAVPQDLLENNSYVTTFSGINSKQQATKKIKGGYMEIANNKFRIPLIYAFEMGNTASDGIAMLLGCNFIRSMNGGLRIEGNIVTFYKNVTQIQSAQTTEVAGTLAEEDWEAYTVLQESLYMEVSEGNKQFIRKHEKLMEELKLQGVIGDDPMKYWEKNNVLCKIDVINPDITIQDKPLKHITPDMYEGNIQQAHQGPA